MGPAGGQLISVEGLNGAGKTTAISVVAEMLTSLGRQVTIADENETLLGARLRSLLLLEDLTIDALTESLLVAGARRQNCVENIQPRLTERKVVICERFTDAFYAFGHARGLPGHLLEPLCDAMTDGIVPALTVLIDLPAELALSRIPTAARHRVEREPDCFHERVRDGYLIRAEAEPDRIKVVDGARPVTDVANDVRAIVRAFTT